MTVSLFTTGPYACRHMERRHVAAYSTVSTGLCALGHLWWRLFNNYKAALEVRRSFVLEPRCAGGPAVRAALFANVSSPVSAVLPLFFFLPFSFSFIVFSCQNCPSPRVRKDLHFTTLLFCRLSPFLRLTSNLVLNRAGVPSLILHSFTPTLTCSPVRFFAFKLSQQKARCSFSPVFFL